MPAMPEEQIRETPEEDEQTVPAKVLETRDSISSIDSDVSLSFDASESEGEVLKPKSHKEIEVQKVLEESDSGSDAGGKDSGCEVASEPPFAPPDDELADRIVQQVEFYFSDASIAKDAFLLKHVRRNKEGFVSLKLVSSFKRVKHLTKDWRCVAHALRRSAHLELNEAGTKLRRLAPLPVHDETTPSRTVVAAHLPLDRPPTVESVAELFRECGEIALVRVLRPGHPIPADVRHFVNKHPSLAGAPCALVEFVQSESARRAVSTAPEPMKVFELNALPPAERKPKKSPAPGANKKGYKVNYQQSYHQFPPTTTTPACGHAHAHCCCCEPDPADSIPKQPGGRCLRRGFSAHFPSKTLEPAAWLQRRLSASSTEASFLYVPRRMSCQADLGGGVGGMRRVSSGSISSSSESGSCCGHLLRRGSSSCGSNQSLGEMAPPTIVRSRSNSGAFQGGGGENVLRLPRGPDGSRGFKQRPLFVNH